MQKSMQLFLLLIFSGIHIVVQAQPSNPPLTQVQLDRLHAVKAWDIEYIYNFTDTWSGGGSLPPGYDLAGKTIDGFNFLSNHSQSYEIRLTVAGKNFQSDCAIGSDSCLTKYQYPAAVSNIIESYDRFSEVHLSNGCPEPPDGNLTGPGFQNLHQTYSVNGSLTLDGTGTNFMRGRFTIDYNVNPPVAQGEFNTAALPSDWFTGYQGCYQSDTSLYHNTSEFYHLFIYPYVSTNPMTGDTQVRLENGKFVIRGSASDNQTFFPCDGAWVPCDSITRGTGSRTTSYEWIIRAHPDSSISVIRPSAAQLFVSGETDTIRWMTDAVDLLRILYSVDSGMTYTEIVDSIPASTEMYVWKIPEALSRKCRVRIESMSDTTRVGLSSLYKMKGYVLTRLTPNGDYEAYTPSTHGWYDPNSSNFWWPESWWQQFDYVTGVDPYTRAVYPPSLFGPPSDSSHYFPDWPLFVRTFGKSTCYTSNDPRGDSADYRYSVKTVWEMMTDKWHGSCEGMAVSSIAAFGNKSAFINHFYPLVDPFNNIGSLNINDNLRIVVNQLMILQFSRAVKANERLPYNSNTPNEAWIDTLKKIFLSEDRSRDVALGLYSQRGNHAMTPYKIAKDSGIIPEPYYLMWVYDPNHPGDDDRTMLLRLSDGFWRYPSALGTAEFINYGRGLKLNPFSLYFGNVEVEYPKTSPRKPAVANAASPTFRIATTTDAFITIKTASGDSSGYADSLTFSTIPGVEPIGMKTGYFLPPIGYELPADTALYDVMLLNYSTTTPFFAVLRDSIMMDYERNGTQPNESDHLTIGNNSLGYSNPDPVVKNINLRSVAFSADEDRVTRVLNHEVSSGSSSIMTLLEGGSAKLTHDGQPTSYVMELIRSKNGHLNTQFRSPTIALVSNATHEIVANWENLSEPVRVKIDLGNDGSVDDSMVVNNILAVPNEPISIPTEFGLSQNYPNPFNPSTAIRFDLPEAGFVSVTVFNILGEKVATLVNERKEVGTYTAQWDATQFPSGIYYCHFTVVPNDGGAKSYSESRTMMLIK